MTRLTYVSLEADFESASRILRIDEDEVVRTICEFDDFVAKHGLDGYIDISDIMGDVLAYPFDINLGWQKNTKYYNFNFTTMDYYQELYDRVDPDEIEFDDEFCPWKDVDDLNIDINKVAGRALVVFNYILLSIARNLSDEQKTVLSDFILRKEDQWYWVHELDIVDPPDYLDIVGDFIVIPCVFNDDRNAYSKKLVRNYDEREKRIYLNYRMSPH